MISRFFSILSWTMALAGSIFLALGIAIAFGVVPWRSELPLFDVQDVICQEDEIYVGLGFHSAVLVHDDAGRYLRTIPVKTYGKPYRFTIGTDGSVHTTHTVHMGIRNERFRISTRIPERILEFQCSLETRTIRQSVGYMLFAGPLPAGLLTGMGVLGILVFDPRALARLFELSSRRGRPDRG